MELINNRYRVLKNIAQNPIISSYLVADLLNDNKRGQFNIFNPNALPDSLYDHYINDFLSLVSLRSSRIFRDFSFGVVNSYDGKRLENKRYYYARESIEDYYSLIDFPGAIGMDKILDVFIQVCQGVNYLHTRGIIYREINLSNIYIKSENEVLSVKLNDFATVELEKNMYWLPKKAQLQFKAPEILNGGRPTVVSDIYSLGVLLLLLHNLNCLPELDYRESIKNLKKNLIIDQYDGNGDYINNVLNIAERMISEDPQKRYKSVDSLVKDINGLFKRNYKSHIIEELGGIKTKTPIVGRQREIKMILEDYYRLKRQGIPASVYFVHGEPGIGKTRFLQELDHIFKIRRVDVFSNLDGSVSASKNDRYLVELLKQFLPMCDADMLEHYNEELVKIIPEMGMDMGVTAPVMYGGEKEKLYLFDRILAFVQECIKTNPAVFILDNIHLMDEEGLELIEYMSANMKNTKIIFLFAYNDNEFVRNERFVTFLDRLEENSKCCEIALGSLNIEETAEFVKNILGLPNTPTRLSTRIYTETYGNPLFVGEVIKNLYAANILYIDENDGEWHIEIDDYDQIPIPTSVYQAVLNQISNLDDESKEILDIISIFNTSVSVNIICEILSCNLEHLEEKLEALVRKGLLDRKVEDWGYAFDLHNRGVKSFIYEKLQGEKRREKHKFAAEFLEKQYIEEGRENKEELIYHLEKAGERDKVVEYCLKTAKNMEDLQFRDEALRKLEKALSMFEGCEPEGRQIEIMIKAGKIHIDEGRNTEALEYYEKALELAGKLCEYRYCIDALNNMANIHMRRNELDKGMACLDKAEEYLKKIDYEEGYLNSQYILVSILHFKQNYEQAIEICSRCIERCRGKFIDLEASFCLQLGITYLDLSVIDKALSNFEYGAKLFEKANNVKGTVRALNNIGVIYGDYYQDIDESINIYLRMKEICERHSILDSLALAESNLAEGYYDKEEYHESQEYYKHSLELFKKLDYETYVFHGYLNLCETSLKLFDYRDAFEYFCIAEAELKKYPVQRKSYLAKFNKVGAELFYSFGDFEKAKDFALKALEFYQNDEFAYKWHIEILIEYIKIFESGNTDVIKECVAKVREINSKYISDLEKANNIYLLIAVLLIKNSTDMINELVEEADATGQTVKSDRITARSLFCKGILRNGKDSLPIFEEAIGHAKKGSLKILEAFIYVSIGNVYSSENQHYNSIKYYFEACELIKKLALQVPEENRLNFMIQHHNLMPFEKLNSVSRVFSGSIGNISIEEYNVRMLTRERLNNLFEYKDLKDILTSRHFLDAAGKDYNYWLPKDVRKINDISKYISGNPTEDLSLIVRYAAKATLATRAVIILTGENQDMSVIASKDSSLEMPNAKYIFEKVNESKEPLFIAEGINSNKNGDVNILPKGIKAVMCIPVIKVVDMEKLETSRERRKGMARKEQITGYLYIESDRILNNFNQRIFLEFSQFRSIIQIIIDNYKLKIISSIDKLTGVFTRKYLEDALKDELERASASGGKFSLIMFDIDKFKNVNDKFGHQKGDLVLREICRIVKENIRKEDVCGRYGGEEFIVILPGTDPVEALAVAEKLREKVEDARILGEKYPVTMSLGVAAYPGNGQMEQELIEKVDQALYIAKESGRNKSQLWNDEISNKARRKDRLAGIVSGNAVQDHRNVLAMIELIELIKDDMDKEDKIYKLLGRIIEITEAQHGMLFLVEGLDITGRYGRRKYEEGWTEVKRFNKNILETVIKEKQGIYRVDWDDISDYYNFTGTPDWQSIIVVPLIKSQIVRGVLYLSVSSKVKEFDFNQFNFVNALGDITAAIL